MRAKEGTTKPERREDKEEDKECPFSSLTECSCDAEAAERRQIVAQGERSEPWE
jgi:hypothetical protein